MQDNLHYTNFIVSLYLYESVILFFNDLKKKKKTKDMYKRYEFTIRHFYVDVKQS